MTIVHGSGYAITVGTIFTELRANVRNAALITTGSIGARSQESERINAVRMPGKADSQLYIFFNLMNSEEEYLHALQLQWPSGDALHASLHALELAENAARAFPESASLHHMKALLLEMAPEHY